MATHALRLRTGLVFSEQRTAAGAFFVVKEPDTGRFFRFREIEHFILQQVDRGSDPEVIQKQVEQRFGAPVAPEAVERLVESARNLGLLVPPGTPEGSVAARPRWVRGSPLYLRVKVFDPDRLFSRLAHLLGFLFTPAFLACSALLILAGIAVGLGHNAEIIGELPRLLRPEVLLFAWLTIFAVSAVHESAHGVTCRRFGGEVHEVGVMLIYLQPAFYCNVSDAWLFPQKSRRLWVTFSGAYFEVVLWALAMLVWRASEPGTLVHLASLVVVATSGIKNLFNLNPLIKLDGYYLLSDLLEAPNLRSRAFAYLGSRLRRLFVGAPESAPPVTGREKRTYLAYGILAAAYSSWLLGVLLAHFGGFLIDRYQGAGFLLFAGVLGTIARRPVATLLSAWRRLPGGAGAPADPRPASRQMIRRSKIIVSAAALLLVAWLGRMDLKVSGEFKVLPIQNADIRAGIDGLVDEIRADEGDRVESGDVVARLSDRELRAELRKVQAEIEEKRAPLERRGNAPRRSRTGVEQDAPVRAEVLDREQTRVRKAEDRLRYAQLALKRSRELLAEGLMSRMEIEEAEEEAAIRGRELQEARSGLSITRSEITATQAAIDRLETQRAYLEDQLRLVEVVAPHGGIVTTPRLQEMIGRFVKAGDLIAEVHETGTVTVEIEIPEKEIADVRVGQRVTLKARARPDRTVAGRVAAIAPAVTEADQKPWLKVVRVSTSIDNPDGLLKSGMTGAAKIVCGRKRILDLVTRRLRSFVRVEFWSWW